MAYMANGGVPMSKKVLIIGAGIAGLSAGSYLQRNGYDVEIFEMHSQPGGVCTAWKRGDYTIDYCIHWLMGTKPDTGFDILWDELGAFKNQDGTKMETRNFEEFTQMEVSNGEELKFYADADRFGEELRRLAPEDTKLVDDLVDDLKYIAKFRIPVAKEKQNPLQKVTHFLSNLGVFRRYLRHLRTPIGEYANKWKSTQVKEAFRSVIPPDWSLASLTMGLAMQHTKAAGYPVGGSLQFALNIERGFLKLGGKINYSSPVNEIIVKDNSAVGIKLKSGEEIDGDNIVSAADGHSTLFDMLGGRYITPRLKQVYDSFPLFPSSVFIGIGVNRDLSHLPNSTYIRTDPPFVLPDESTHSHLSTTVYNFDPTLAPEGKTTVTVILHTWNDSYWSELASSDRAKYNATKDQIGTQVLEAVGRRFPDIKDSAEVIDVSTPHTVKRYTNNWRGSFEGFAATPMTLITRLPKAVPGLRNCYMIGQWTTPGGGIPTAALDGRNIAIDLCKKDKKRFTP
jgi:phytoene dehydrogenase-like protein